MPTPSQTISKLQYPIDGALTLVGCTIAVLLSPIFYLWHRIYSPGPVLYKSLRAGKDGKTFTCYKFRTMVPNAHKLLPSIINDPNLAKENLMKGPIFKMKKDPRLLPLASIPRRFSLDEFPQFFNVLCGDMNIVGPRPPTIEEVNQYNQEAKKRLSIKPGITGLWQVSGRNDIKDFQEILKLDLQYINNQSLALNLKIIMKTLWVVIKGRGAY
jgi:lipopolysaccharide/colanic/teichoic acid biosynthesis glycosyltransferase